MRNDGVGKVPARYGLRLSGGSKPLPASELGNFLPRPAAKLAIDGFEMKLHGIRRHLQGVRQTLGPGRVCKGQYQS